MWKFVFVLLCSAAGVIAEPADEWEQFRKTGLFPADGKLWLAPDMAAETMAAFTSRLLDGARQGEAKAVATLGRFFFMRGDLDRAVEWLEKAAQAGHSGAQFDFGTLSAQGRGVPVDVVEGYKWLWLATWDGVPGADGALRELSGRLGSSQIVQGIRRAAQFQDAHRKPDTQRFRVQSSK